MSKKLIAVAAAAALALTGLVATPASATAIQTVTINHSTSVGEGEQLTVSHASATNAVVPSSSMTSRTLDWNATGSTSRNVIRFQVVTTAATTVTVTSASGVLLSDKLVDADDAALKITAGVTSLPIATNTANSLTATFYAYSTSTTAGTVTVTTPGSSLRYFVKAKLGAPYNLTNVKFPTSVLSGDVNVLADNTNKVTYNVTDAFGNAIEDATVALTVFPLGTAVNSGYQSTTKQYVSFIHGATASTVSMNLALAETTDLSANGFAAPVKSAFASVSAGDLAAQVKSLTASVTALQAALANTVTKAKYNNLVKKYNKITRGKKASLVK